MCAAYAFPCVFDRLCTILTTLLVDCRTLCDPYLNLFRGLIPPIGGTIDLSPILAFIVLDVRLPVDWAD